MQNISSFALYGFPESHAASFALIAYASAYFKVKYLAAFTCAILNNQPMGFYSPAVLVKDAQRHGLRVKPIDIQVSDWPCTVEHEADGYAFFAHGTRLRQRHCESKSAEALVASREQDGAFRSAEDLALRVPSLNRKELTLLARIGALNQLDGIAHRRDALWQVERAGKPGRASSPAKKRMAGRRSRKSAAAADEYGGATGRRLCRYRTDGRQTPDVLSPSGAAAAGNSVARRNYETIEDGEFVRTAGCVIARQRPGTAKGFIFLSMEDEDRNRQRHRHARSL